MIFTQNPLLFLWVWKLLIVSFTSVYWRHGCGKNIIVTFLEYTECIFRGVQYAGCLVTWTIKFCMVVCNIFSTLFFFFSMKKGITSHGLNQVASDNIMVHRSFLGCGSSVQNVLDVICLVGPQYRTFLMSFVLWVLSTELSWCHLSCGSSVQNFLDVICLLHRIWRGLQDFWKIIGPLHLLSDLNVCSRESVVSDLTWYVFHIHMTCWNSFWYKYIFPYKQVFTFQSMSPSD